MENKEINLGISKIRDIEFSINEVPLAKNPEEIGISFEFTPIFRFETSDVDFCITVTFFKKNDSETLMKIKVCTTFVINELQQLFDKETGGYDIPENILLTMLSLSLTHTRAIHAIRVAGTIYSTLIVPIVNPQDMYNFFFNRLAKSE